MSKEEEGKEEVKITRFGEFVELIKEQCRTKYSTDGIYNSVKKQIKTKSGKYLDFVSKIRGHWEKYEEKFNIAEFIKKNHLELFTYYFCDLFPLSLERLRFINLNVVSGDELEVELIYHFNLDEVAAILKLKKFFEVKVKTGEILQSIIQFCIRSLATIFRMILEEKISARFIRQEKEEEIKKITGEYDITTKLLFKVE